VIEARYAIMSHYSDDISLVSPVAVKLLNDPAGTVLGKEALRSYFQKVLDIYPELNFQLIDVFFGLNSVVLNYLNQRGIKTTRFQVISAI